MACIATRRPCDARVSDFREPGGSPLAQHLHGRTSAAPGPREDCLTERAALYSYTNMIIAIDGPAASGKGAIGKRLAAHFGLRHLDTGLLYRAVAKAVLDAGSRPDDAARAAAAAKSLDPVAFDEAAL